VFLKFRNLNARRGRPSSGTRCRVANTHQGHVVLACSRQPRHPARLILLHSCPCLAPSSLSCHHGAELHRPRRAAPPPHWSSSTPTHCIATALASSCTHHLGLLNPGIAAFRDPPRRHFRTAASFTTDSATTAPPSSNSSRPQTCHPLRFTLCTFPEHMTAK
jgi:hypothetical protein